VRSQRELAISTRLADARGRQVAFVSHCLLNENTRYLGGAFHPGAVPEIIELQRRGIGIHQMRCPEQRAWGGALKRYMLLAYGSKGTLLYRLRRPLLRLFTWYTRSIYWRLARAVVKEIEDYERSGIRVIGIVGVGASPSCGVTTTLDLRRSFEVIASCPVAGLERDTFNERAVADCRIVGEGLFIRTLKRQLSRRQIEVPLLEHDLVAEMHGDPQVSLEVLAGPSGDASARRPWSAAQ
jgi:predicted secreted protein